MSRRDKIDGVLIDSDENGFHLILSGEEAEYNFMLVGESPLELLKAAQAEIGPYREEIEAVFAGFREERVVAVREDGSYRTEPDEDAYDPTDPKHPTYHERMSAVYDEREGK